MSNKSTPDELLLLEIDYTPGEIPTCKSLRNVDDPKMFCHRMSGHKGNIHAARIGYELVKWESNIVQFGRPKPHDHETDHGPKAIELNPN